MYEIAIKKGCRCIQIDIYVENNNKEDVVVKNNAHASSKKSILLVDVLKTIKNIAFSFNQYPLILAIQANFNVAVYGAKIARIFIS